MVPNQKKFAKQTRLQIVLYFYDCLIFAFWHSFFKLKFFSAMQSYFLSFIFSVLQRTFSILKLDSPIHPSMFRQLRIKPTMKILLHLMYCNDSKVQFSTLKFFKKVLHCLKLFRGSTGQISINPKRR